MENTAITHSSLEEDDWCGDVAFISSLAIPFVQSVPLPYNNKPAHFTLPSLSTEKNFAHGWCLNNFAYTNAQYCMQHPNGFFEHVYLHMSNYQRLSVFRGHAQSRFSQAPPVSPLSFLPGTGGCFNSSLCWLLNAITVHLRKGPKGLLLKVWRMWFCEHKWFLDCMTKLQIIQLGSTDLIMGGVLWSRTMRRNETPVTEMQAELL